MRLQITIRRGEVPATDKATMGGKWRRMDGFQYSVPTRIDQLAFALCVRAPQHEDDAFPLPIERIDRRIGETFPALALMRSGLSTLHREHCVE